MFFPRQGNFFPSISAWHLYHMKKTLKPDTSTTIYTDICYEKHKEENNMYGTLFACHTSVRRKVIMEIKKLRIW